MNYKAGVLEVCRFYLDVNQRRLRRDNSPILREGWQKQIDEIRAKITHIETHWI